MKEYEGIVEHEGWWSLTWEWGSKLEERAWAAAAAAAAFVIGTSTTNPASWLLNVPGSASNRPQKEERHSPDA